MTESIGKNRRVRKTAGGDDVGANIPPAVPDYPVRTKDKVAIVGFADGHRDQAPFADPDFEIWGLNRLHSAMPGKRWDRWFEIHDLGMYLGEKPDEEHLAFLRTFPGPVYIRPQDVGRVPIPSAQPYPLTAILRDFPNYFNNSISYELALAIVMGYKVIHLYGVDMAQDALFGAEYAEQRPSCELFIGIALGHGVEIYKPPGSDLLVCDHLYGFQDPSIILGKRQARMGELGRRKDTVRAKLAELEAQKAVMDRQYWEQRLNLHGAINQMDGAQQEIAYESRNLSAPAATL